MLDRLLMAVMGLFGFAGMAVLLFATVVLPEEIQRYDEIARVSQRVQARLVSVGVRTTNAGRQSNKPRYHYTPVGVFEIVGEANRVYDNVDLDHGKLHIDQAEAKNAGAHYRQGIVVDAWFDPRSQHDHVHFPLSIDDPAVIVSRKRADRKLMIRAGAGSLLIAAVFAMFVLRRGK